MTLPKLRFTRLFLSLTKLKRLLILQFILLTLINLFSAPAFDEWGHLPSGLYHIQFSDYWPYQVNPPLVRLIAAFPAWLAGGGFDYVHPIVNWEVRSEWRLAEDFFQEHGLNSLFYFWIGREVLLFFPLFGTYLIHSIARQYSGVAAARIATCLWVFSPLVLAFGSLLVPDIPATVLGLWAVDRFVRWLKETSTRNISMAAVATGLAMLTKSTWVILPVAFLLIAGIDRWRSKSWHAWRRDGRHLCSAAVITWFVIHAGYEFQGVLQPLGQFEFHSEALGGNRAEQCQSPGAQDSAPQLKTGNRFRGSVFGWIPSPLPAAYLKGIDLQKLDFEAGFDSYLFGVRQNGGWWYYYLVGLFLKQSLFLWIMLPIAFFSALRRWRRKQGRSDFYWLALIGVPGCFVLILVSSQTGFNHHLRYVFAFLPILFLFCAQAGRGPYRQFGMTLAAMYAVSGLASMPRPYAFFNATTGGAIHGWKYMDNSNLDWGQDWFTAVWWLQQNPEKKPVYVLYSIPPARLEGLPYPVIDGKKHLRRLNDARWVPSESGYWLVFVQYLTMPEGQWFRDRGESAILSPSIRLYVVEQDDITTIDEASKIVRPGAS
jgi:hypothetical protein